MTRNELEQQIRDIKADIYDAYTEAHMLEDELIRLEDRLMEIREEEGFIISRI